MEEICRYIVRYTVFKVKQRIVNSKLSSEVSCINSGVSIITRKGWPFFWIEFSFIYNFLQLAQIISVAKTLPVNSHYTKIVNDTDSSDGNNYKRGPYICLTFINRYFIGLTIKNMIFMQKKACG